MCLNTVSTVMSRHTTWCCHWICPVSCSSPSPRASTWGSSRASTRASKSKEASSYQPQDVPCTPGSGSCLQGIRGHQTSPKILWSCYCHSPWGETCWSLCCDHSRLAWHRMYSSQSCHCNSDCRDIGVVIRCSDMKNTTVTLYLFTNQNFGDIYLNFKWTK